MAKATTPGWCAPTNEDSIERPADRVAVLADGIGWLQCRRSSERHRYRSDLRARPAKRSPGMRRTNWTRIPVLRWRPAYSGKSSPGNTSIFQSANSQPQYAGMGTTLVVTLLCNNQITVAHIGDSAVTAFAATNAANHRDHSLRRTTRQRSAHQEAAKRSQKQEPGNEGGGHRADSRSGASYYPARPAHLSAVLG